MEVARAAHRRAHEAIKGVRPETQVGLTVVVSAWQALPGGEATLERTARSRRGRVPDDVEGDFIGVQNYSGLLIGPDGPVEPPAGVERTQMGYPYQPEALEHAVRRAAAVTGLPVIVTENGLATDDDAQRSAFIERALRGVAACMRDGVDVRGYVYWSLFDNFEWVFGYRPTFGLVAVDRATQVRSVKPSAHRLAEIARTGSLAG